MSHRRGFGYFDNFASIWKESDEVHIEEYRVENVSILHMVDRVKHQNDALNNFKASSLPNPVNLI
jgi:hypothetical protein